MRPVDQLHCSKRMVRAPICLICVVSMSVLAGCMTYTDQRAKTVARTRIAVLEQPFTTDAFVTKVNGKSRGIGLFTRFELPPGRNTIVMAGNKKAGNYVDDAEVAFNAEEGKTYVVKYRIGPYEGPPRGTIFDFFFPTVIHAWIIDKSTGEAVDEASLSKRK